MIGCLFVLAALSPQEPERVARRPTAELLQAVSEDAGATDEIRAILSQVRPRTRRIEGPTLAVELRAAGLGAPDLAREALDPLAQQGASTDELLVAVARAFGDRRVAQAARRGFDLDAFETEISHVHRDLVQALGGRLDPDRAFARWGSIADRFAQRGLASAPESSVADEASDARAGMDGAELRLLAGRVLHAACALDVEELVVSLRGTEPRPARSDGAVQGDVFLDRDGPFGRLVVGGTGPNSYDCTQIDVIVDLGGADEYRGPAGGADGSRRLGVVVDLDGNDVYRGGQDGLGSATFGIGVLYDRAGDDRYEAVGRGLGFGVAGVGLLVDVEGSDQYAGGALCGGVGCHGVGLLADLAGDDRYELGGHGAGVGLPGGFGLFFDRAGDDRIGFAVDPGAFSGLGTGFGSGTREDGGLGVALDAAGDDQVVGPAGVGGVGFDRGVGVHWELAGADRIDCGEASLGFGFGHGLGLFVDEGGDDRRAAGARSLGYGEGAGLGFALDLAGTDESAGAHPSLGEGRDAGLGVHADLAGVDAYRSVRAAGDPPADAERTRGRPRAVGLLVDLGGSGDRYEFDRVPGLHDGQSRRLEGGDAGPWARYLVDRGDR